jgi:UDP-2,4-diacetamido-2,4,6-trideoxy-beta-L-altropyranose hydrolase
MPTVAIHCKASVHDGMGHIYRQINLASELRKQGWEITFYIPNFSPAIGLLTQSGFSSIISDFESSIPKNLENFFDFFILDMQNTTELLVYTVKKNSRWTVSFEDLGKGRNYVDILVDCNQDKSESKNIPSNTKGLFGLDYSILHLDFDHYHKQSRKFNISLKSLLITMGATDPKNLTLPLIHFLIQEKSDIELTVLIGYNITSSPELSQFLNKFKSLNILGPVQNMAQILWEHDAVICSGGITLHEAIAVGTPAFVVNQVEHQQTKAKFVERLGAAINLGVGNQYDVKKLREVLSFRKPALESMSLKAKQLIDGRGIFRVIDAMKKMIKV